MTLRSEPRGRGLSLGMGPFPSEGQEDANLIKAGKQPKSCPPNGSFQRVATTRYPLNRWSYSKIAFRRTCAPAEHSSKVVFSASLWLKPPSHGTKIIVVGATRAI